MTAVYNPAFLAWQNYIKFSAAIMAKLFSSMPEVNSVYSLPLKMENNTRTASWCDKKIKSFATSYFSSQQRLSAETVWEQKIFKSRGQYEKHGDENKFYQA